MRSTDGDQASLLDVVSSSLILYFFLKKVYEKTLEEYAKDALDKESTASANFVFPVLDDAKQEVIGAYSKDGINISLSQLKTNRELYLKKLNEKFNKLQKHD